MALKSLAKSFLRALFRRVPIPIRGPLACRVRRSAFQVPAEVPTGFYSQKGQDYRLTALLGGRRGGVFVDVGAYDGVTGSNTYYFERQLGWTGLCVEPNPDVFPALAAARRAKCVNVAISPISAEAPFVKLSGAKAQLSGLAGRFKEEKAQQAIGAGAATAATVSVPTRRLDELLEESEIERVDLLSLDIEGSELEALRSFDFATVPVWMICVENSRVDNAIDLFLRRRGFELALTIGREEEIYVNRRWPEDA